MTIPAGQLDGVFTVPTVDDGFDEPDETVEAAGAPQTSIDRSAGPFDVSEVEGREGRVDIGALWLQGVPGMELRLEVDQNTQQVNAATAVIRDSALQVQAFAAPRPGGLWNEIRGELATARSRAQRSMRSASAGWRLNS